MFSWLKRLFGIGKAVAVVPSTGICRALCVGIDDYPGTANDLQKCVQDAVNWGNLLKNKFKFTSVQTLINNEATRANIRRMLSTLVEVSKPGDVLVFTFSGHGTSVPDAGKDEPDYKDEALVVYGQGSYDLLLDDELRLLLGKLRRGVRLAVVADCCHSGTITRAINTAGAMIPSVAICGDGQSRRIRYLPVSNISEDVLKEVATRQKLLFSEKGMNHVLLAGCKSSEYSYEIAQGGALTHYATTLLRQNQRMTWLNFYNLLRKHLPAAIAPQTPQLEGPIEYKRLFVFK